MGRIMFNGKQLKHSRSKVILVTRNWLGTPYHHQASVRGAGCDCLGLVRGVFRDLYGYEAEDIPAYNRDWSEVGGEETLLNAGREHLVETNNAKSGDVLIFRFKRGALAKHAAIYVGGGE